MLTYVLIYLFNIRGNHDNHAQLGVADMRRLTWQRILKQSLNASENPAFFPLNVLVSFPLN